MFSLRTGAYVIDLLLVTDYFGHKSKGKIVCKDLTISVLYNTYKGKHCQ